MTKGEEPTRPRRVRISDVAAALGVAVSTVSNAYNRPDQLSAELRERVLATAAQLGYAGPSAVARSLRQQRADAVGVIFAERLSYAFTDPASVQVLEGIASALEQARIGLLLVPGRSDSTTTVERALVDGFIVYSILETDPLVTAALARRIPTVLLDQPPRAGVPSITIDDADGARQAAEHLLRHGHRRFAIITDRLTESAAGEADSRSLHQQAEQTFFVTQMRFRGYRAAIEQAGIPWPDVRIVERDDNSEADGASAMRALLEDPPTAVICLTDRLALGAMRAAQQAGLRVPQNLSIVGFDDIPETATCTPPLTTVRQGHRQKGILAGRALLALLRGDAEIAHTNLPVELVVRGSSGPAPERPE